MTLTSPATMYYFTDSMLPTVFFLSFSLFTIVFLAVLFTCKFHYDARIQRKTSRCHEQLIANERKIPYDLVKV
uniref:Neur_chan_memb domain-containing protein n=1 Tax=Caenorhabditis tropicalis TaxID=1561998 RepID=A0A1I7U9K7_9PELO